MTTHGTDMISSSERQELLPGKIPAPNYDGRNLVFVVGCARSGTTWLQRLLSCHPCIYTGPESHIFAVNIGPQLQAWKKMGALARRGIGLNGYFTEEEFLSTLKQYLASLLTPMIAQLGPNGLFLEKSPPHSFFLREIFELLPRARVIHMLRDPRDVVSSLLAGDEWMSWWAPKNARDAAGLWAKCVESVRNVAPELGSGQFLEVRYESLSLSPTEVLRECIDFLGLEWCPEDIAKAVEANRASLAKAGGGTPIPLSGEAEKRLGPVVVEPKGFIRKAKPGAWKDDLSLKDKFWVWRTVHHLMDEVGYAWPKMMESTFAWASNLIDIVKGTLSFGRR